MSHWTWKMDRPQTGEIVMPPRRNGSHCPLALLTTDAKQNCERKLYKLCNAFEWYTMEYPMSHLYFLVYTWAFWRVCIPRKYKWQVGYAMVYWSKMGRLDAISSTDTMVFLYFDWLIFYSLGTNWNLDQKVKTRQDKTTLGSDSSCCKGQTLRLTEPLTTPQKRAGYKKHW